MNKTLIIDHVKPRCFGTVKRYGSPSSNDSKQYTLSEVATELHRTHRDILDFLIRIGYNIPKKPPQAMLKWRLNYEIYLECLKQFDKIRWQRTHETLHQSNVNSVENIYGFISVENNQEIYLNSKDVYSEKKICEGSVVTFEIVRYEDNKVRAVNVKCLSEETDKNTIMICLNNNKISIWLDAFLAFIKLADTHELVVQAERGCDLLGSAAKDKISDLLPEEAYFKSKKLRALLTQDRHFKILSKMLLNDQLLSNRDNVSQFEEMSEFLDVINSTSSNDVFELLKKSIFANSPILRNKLPLMITVDLLVQLIAGNQNETDTNLLLDELKEKFQLVLQDKEKDGIEWEKRVDEFLFLLPEEIIILDPFLQFLPPKRQVELTWESVVNNTWSEWYRISSKAKILTIFRALKENIEFPEASLFKSETDPVVRFSCLLFWAKFNKNLLFSQVHLCFQEYVTTIAWELDFPLDFSPLLPSCKNESVTHVKYCEGRYWKEKQIEKNGKKQTLTIAFCPRLKKECEVFNGQDSSGNCQYYGARLLPVLSQDWSEWSMLELLNACNITPVLRGLRDPIGYVPKVSGWINRLMEIRERLKCSVCQKVMIPNQKYAYRWAAYNMTIVSCNCGNGHDNNVYLNHCWGCYSIIDSRESRHQLEGLYICINCGSGPQDSGTYSQGDVCPNCGVKVRMNSIDHFNRRLRCNSCGHQIQLPPKRKLSGPEAVKSNNSPIEISDNEI